MGEQEEPLKDILIGWSREIRHERHLCLEVIGKGLKMSQKQHLFLLFNMNLS